MQAGKLRHFVVIEQQTTAQDAFGEPSPVWTSFAEAWASVEELPGTGRYVAGQAWADVPTRITVRYIEGVLPAMRVNVSGVLYNITSVADPDGSRRSLTLLAQRVY